MYKNQCKTWHNINVKHICLQKKKDTLNIKLNFYSIILFGTVLSQEEFILAPAPSISVLLQLPRTLGQVCD